MKYYTTYFIITIFLLAIGCNNTPTPSAAPTGPTTEPAVKPPAPSDIPVLTFDQLAPIFQRQTDTTYLINFWATWCAPCVKELPYFEEYIATQQGKRFKAIFVSLDFPKQIDKKLKPFIQKKPLPGDVVVLDDPDANAWIPRVDPEWSGAIPATIVYHGDRKIFAERSFHSAQELADWVKTLK